MIASATFRRFVSLVALFVMLAGLALPLLPSARTVSAADLAADPGTTALAIRTGLYQAQQDLLAGDNNAAQHDLDGIAKDVATFTSLIANAPVAKTSIETAWSDAQGAVKAKDADALASARGTLWTAMLGAGYAETIAAVRANDAKTAGAWLLLREFRPTTKFARPGADATLAVKNLEAGTISSDEAVAVINADLLDTYQSKLDAELTTLADATTKGFSARAAESAALVQGYWTILEPAYASQMGADAAATANTTVASLVGTVQAGKAPTDAIAQVTALSRSFRAAPLSEAEMARRAGQLVRYLSLIPVEYGRDRKSVV